MKFCVNMYLDTSRTILNFKVILKGQGRIFWVFFLCARYCNYPRTVLSLEQGLTILLELDVETHSSCSEMGSLGQRQRVG